MREASTVSERATGDASTRLEERAFGEAGSSVEALARFRQSARSAVTSAWGSGSGRFGFPGSRLKSWSSLAI
jgi:hypothetical protein